VEAAEEAVAVAPAEVAAAAAAGPVNAVAAAAAGPVNAVAAAAAGPVNAVAAAGPDNAVAAAGPDNAAVEVALNALVDMAQIHIANAAAEAGAIVAGGDVANSQALVHDALAVAPSNEVAENAINLLIPAVNNAMSPAVTPASSQEVEMSQRSYNSNNNIRHPFGFGGRRKTLKNRKNRRKQLSRRRR
jgi:ribonuclease E